MRNILKQVLSTIIPYDSLEEEHLVDIQRWIDSGAPLFRIKKPDIPPKHLVSYFVLIDQKTKKLLLINHKKAKLLLPPGGHVEPNEHPNVAVERELKEELGITANFLQESPLFVTVTKTVNTDVGHTDVSLWYLLKGDVTQELLYDKKEMSGYHWLSFDEALKLPKDTTDPHLHRFIRKLLGMVERE